MERVKQAAEIGRQVDQGQVDGAGSAAGLGVVGRDELFESVEDLMAAVELAQIRGRLANMRMWSAPAFVQHKALL